MRIVGLDVFVVAVPYIPVLRKYRPNEPFEQPDPIVRLRTDDGLVGVGESGRGGRPEQILNEFKTFKGRDPFDLHPQDYESGFMQALYDLQGKVLGWPVYRLLGRKIRDKVPAAYWTVETATPEETAAEAEIAVRKGFKVYKWHTNPTVDNTVARARAVEGAVGGRLALRIDRGYSWDLPMAVRIARQLSGCNIECFEDPIPKRDPTRYRLLREKVDIPLAWHVGSAQDALIAVRTGAVDYLNVSAKPGVLAAISAITETAGVLLWLQICGVGGTGLLSAFAAHMGAVTSNATLPGDNLHYLREDDLLEPHLEVQDGFMEVPDRPGLGVELDMEAVGKYQMAYHSV